MGFRASNQISKPWPWLPSAPVCKPMVGSTLFPGCSTAGQLVLLLCCPGSSVKARSSGAFPSHLLWLQGLLGRLDVRHRNSCMQLEQAKMEPCSKDWEPVLRLGWVCSENLESLLSQSLEKRSWFRSSVLLGTKQHPLGPCVCPPVLNNALPTPYPRLVIEDCVSCKLKYQSGQYSLPWGPHGTVFFHESTCSSSNRL